MKLQIEFEMELQLNGTSIGASNGCWSGTSNGTWNGRLRSIRSVSTEVRMSLRQMKCTKRVNQRFKVLKLDRSIRHLFWFCDYGTAMKDNTPVDIEETSLQRGSSFPFSQGPDKTGCRFRCRLHITRNLYVLDVFGSIHHKRLSFAEIANSPGDCLVKHTSLRISFVPGFKVLSLTFTVCI